MFRDLIPTSLETMRFAGEGIGFAAMMVMV